MRKKGTISDNTLFAKMLKEDEEENIAPIAYLILELPQKAKSLSPQRSFNDFMNFIAIEDVELKDSEQNIIGIRIQGKDIVRTNEYESNLERVYCYPNPTTDKITFANLTKQIRVKIFNIAGELVYGEQEHVANVNGEWEWDCRNNSGEMVASGIYVYILQDTISGSTKKEKIGIVR